MKSSIYLLFCFACTFCTGIGAQEVVPDLISPTLKMYMEKARSDSAGAENEFWKKIHKSGTPLIEPVTGDNNHSLMSFIFRDSSFIRNIRLESNINALHINGITINFNDLGWMKKLPNTNTWYISYKVKNDLRVPYLFEVYKEQAGKENLNRETVTDPFNDNVYMPGNNDLRQSVAVMAGAPQFSAPLKNSAEGLWITIPFFSAQTKKQEEIFVYLPASIDTLSKTRYPLIIGLQTYSFRVAMPTDRIIDQLCQNKEIFPPVFISVDYQSYNEQADLDSLSSFLINEVVPRVSKRFPVHVNGKNVTLSGTSRRGLASSYLAFQHPDKFGNVLSMSGSFFWKPAAENEFEWLSRQIATGKVKDVRFYIAAGSLETVVTPRNYGHYMVATNRNLRNVLAAKAYTFRYHEFEGVHHEVNWQYELYNGLKYLLSTK